MTSPHIVCCAASPPLQRCASFLLLFYFVRVPSPSNNFQLKVCNLFKGKVAFGFFCQKTEGVFSFSFITSTHPVCFAATPPFQGGEYPPRLLCSHPSLTGRGLIFIVILFCFVRVPSPRSEEHTSELQSRENLVC